METLNHIVTFLIFTTIIVTPVFCVLKNYSFIKLYLVSTSLISLMLIVAAFWPHFYTELRLDLMGFNFDGMSDAERAKNVAPELRAEATNLYWSNNGVGWPLKAIIWMIILLPYPVLIWLIGFAQKKLSNRFDRLNNKH